MLIDATHPYAAVISANAARAAEIARVPLLALRRPPWRKASRRRLDRGRDGRGCRDRRSAKRRGACSWRSAARSSRPSRQRRSISISCAASIPSTRRSPCRMRATSPRAVPSPRQADRALLETPSHRDDRRQEQRRRRDLRQDRSGAGAAHSGDHAEAPGSAGGRVGRRRSRRFLPGSIMPSRLRRPAAYRPAGFAPRARSAASRASRR